MKRFLFLAIPAALLLNSCDFVDGEKVEGNGNVKSSDRSINGFLSVESNGSIDVYVSSAPTEAVRVEADENLLPLIETYKEGETLHIKTKKGYWLKPSHDIKVYVTAPSYHAIHSYGSGNIVSENKIIGNGPLDLGVTGSADIRVEVDAPEVHADITGSGNCIISGGTKKFSSEISGSGSVKAFDLKSEETKIDIAGSGDADVFASTRLDVSVSGSGDVRYKGNAQNVSQHVAGSGSVRKVD